MKLLKSCLCCCCCLSLKTGTIIIGCLDFFKSLTLFISCLIIVILSQKEEYKKEFEGLTAEYKKELYMYIVESVVSIIASVLLIIGAKKENFWMLLSWIASAKLGIITFSVSGILFLSTGDRYTAGEKVLQTFLIIAILGVLIYPLCVVLSYFQELKIKILAQHANMGSYNMLINDDALNFTQVPNEDNDCSAVVTN